MAESEETPAKIDAETEARIRRAQEEAAKATDELRKKYSQGRVAGRRA